MSDPYGPWYDDEDDPRHVAPARRSLRDVVGDLVFRYQTARLSTQVTIDVLAATAVMALAIGVAVLLRDPGPHDVATAGTTTTQVATTVSTLPPTTTTTMPPTTTTTVPPTTTTTRPRPTTTVPPPPPTEAPAPPPPTAPPTTEVYYRSCDAAARAGAALPIPVGTPGYRAELDRDHDGLACERGDRPWDGWE